MTEAGRRLSRKRIALTLATLALCVLGPALTSCSSAADGAADAADGRRQLPYWDEKATPGSVGAQLDIELPAKAADRRAAYQHGFQDDQLLLAFTLPTSKVDAFIEQLGPERELRQRDKPRPDPVTPTAPFSHLGLEDPETLPDVLEGRICSVCDGDPNALKIAVHQLDDSTSRIYLRGVN
ncbi:hypothetical protein ACIRFF_26835 [Streptomyces cyaneofuscatus]